MGNAANKHWLLQFAVSAIETDRFEGSDEQVALLAAGLIGEAGSIISEIKKKKREREAYPVYRERMREEIGDFLWYYVRLANKVDKELLNELKAHKPTTRIPSLAIFLNFGASVGDLLKLITANGSINRRKLGIAFRNIWDLLNSISREESISLAEAAEHNLKKIANRWPAKKSKHFPLFDEGFPEEELLARKLLIEFKERSRGVQKAVILRCNGINFGDRLTDNIEDQDGYRYHDVFHFAHAVHLGWSPVMRALLRCKRKSRPEIDEAQDGARAVIIEEAVSAIVFNRAKQLDFFKGLDHIDYALLKTVQEFVQGYEVERVPVWQWETAILEGYRVFRLLQDNSGGSVALDLESRELVFTPPPRELRSR